LDGPVTIREIAKRAGVSIGTVSHVINGTARVREKLRQRVLEAIGSLNYHPSQLGRGLRRNQTSMLGMIIPDVTNPFFPAVVRGLEDVAYRDRYRVILCNTDNDPEKEISYLNELHSYRPSGLLLIPAAGSRVAASLKRFAASGIPVVCIDRQPPGWNGDLVLVANDQGTYEATRHLLRMGHSRVAVVTGPHHLPNAVERLRGFEKATAEAGVSVQPEWVQEARFDRHSGYEAAMRLLALHPRPTAILACNDMMALGTLQAVRESNLRCPEDVSIVGFDNLEFTEFTAPALTSVHQPGYELGATAGRRLLETIRGLNPEPRTIVLQTELKIRNSVALLNAQNSNDMLEKRGDAFGTKFSENTTNS
jgi:DNA-binding LacI/PurR family transcriptional regulator